MQESINPRHLREKYQEWVGKRVVAGLTTYHYVCGTWEAIEGHNAVFKVGPQTMRFKLQEIDNVSPAVPAQADFYK
jgi:hypothetical protein